jgi:hypothetical protein
MDELRKQLDDEARRVEAKPDALETMRRRAGRRRVTRQVGSGVAALAIAGGGFALAFSAFRGGPTGVPLVGPSSPTASAIVVGVEAPPSLQAEAIDLSQKLMDAGYAVERSELPEGGGPSHTIVGYSVGADEEARAIIRRFLPRVSATGTSYPGTVPQVEIRIGPDYQEIVNDGVRVRILDGAGLEGAAMAAATILEGEGYNVIEVRQAGASYNHTFISCPSENEAQAERIRQDLFSKAEIRGAIPDEDHDVTVHIGRDFYDDYAGLKPG